MTQIYSKSFEFDAHFATIGNLRDGHDMRVSLTDMSKNKSAACVLIGCCRIALESRSAAENNTAATAAETIGF